MSNIPASVDDVRLPGGEAGFIGCEIDGKCGDFFWPAQATHRLPGDEVTPYLFFVSQGGNPFIERGRLHSARTNCIAANALTHKVNGNGFC